MTDWLRSHLIVSVLLVIWTVTLVSTVTVKAFFDPVSIPTGTATALATVYGLPAVTIGLYKARLKIEEYRSGDGPSK